MTPIVTAQPEIELNPLERIIASVEQSAAAFFELLPGLALGIVVFLVFLGAGRLLRTRLEPRLAEKRTPSFGQVFATLLYVGLVVFGLVVGAGIAFPTLNLATMVAGLGLLGVAAGFAFQDILSNLLAGVLLIFRQPFVSGDQIEVDGHRGTVEGITIRETRLRTFGGRLIIIPNADVYTNAIEVQTAAPQIRSDVTVGVAYGSDLGESRRLALETLGRIEGVASDPAPQAFYTEFGGSAIDLDLRYWTDPHQAEIRAVRDRVIEAIHDAFEDAGIEIPFDIITLDAGESLVDVMGNGSG